MWATKSPLEALNALAKPDVVVTNEKDKTIQLKKILELDAKVKTAWALLGPLQA